MWNIHMRSPPGCRISSTPPHNTPLHALSVSTDPEDAGVIMSLCKAEERNLTATSETILTEFGIYLMT